MPSALPLGELAIVAVGCLLSWAVDHHPAMLPAWAPYDFPWWAFLPIGLVLVWFQRGRRRASASERIGAGRSLCFLVGIGAIYAVLLTHFEYLAQHMFFLNRVQHAVLHHLGPFLIALSWPGATIARGMPRPLQSWFQAPRRWRMLDPLQQPLVAVLLFEGLLFFWLLPPVTFRAMLDTRIYAIMNASMLIDGLLFWFLVLDPRPGPPGRIGFVSRFCLAFGIIFPQIAVGTALGLAQHDLYPSFELCGRVFPHLGPLADQQIGGLVLWVPAGMMSAIAAVLIMARLFSHEDQTARVVL